MMNVMRAPSCGRFILLCSLALLLAGCKKDEALLHTGATYCVESAPTSMNPQLYNSGTLGASISHQVYDRLLMLNPLTQRLEGALATRWMVTPDGLTYTLTLRRGVQFHKTPWFTPTRTFNADDVIFSFDRMRLENHPFHEISGGLYPFFDNSGFIRQISDIRKISDSQVEFTLRQPNAAFLASLASDYAVILSDEYAQKMLAQHQPELIDTLAVGTGPFIQQEFRSNEFVRLHRNPQYWDRAPELERLAFDYTPKPTKRLAKLLTGECQVMASPAPSHLNFIRNQSNLSLDEESGLNTAFLALNVQKKPFTDIRVRRAIALALNRDNLLKAVYLGSAEWANTLLPPISWAHNPNVDAYNFDLDAARKLLKEAGLEDGFDMTVWVRPSLQEYNLSSLKTAQMIQSDLAKLNINVQIVQLRWSAMRLMLQEGRHDSVVLFWSADTPDPDSFFRPLLSCNSQNGRSANYSRWCNADFEKLLEQATTTTHMAQRIEAYHQMQEIVYQDIPLIPLAHTLHLYASWKNIHNIEVTPAGGLSFKRAYRE